MKSKNESNFLKLAYLYGKVKELQEAFLIFPEEFYQESIENILEEREEDYSSYQIGDIVFEMAMDTYGHYFSGIVVLVEVEPNTYKMIEK